MKYYHSIILLGGFLVRLFLYKKGAYFLDLNTFISWAQTLSENGLANFYQLAWSDYLPGYLYILWFLGKVEAVLGIPALLLYKLPAVISDILTALIIYLIVRKIKNKKWGLIASFFYVFNPAIIANSTLWGQVDSLTSFLSLLAVWLVDKNLFVSALALSFGTLVKPQAAFVAPVILFVMLKKKWGSRRILQYIILSFLIFVLGFVPFAKDVNLYSFILERISVTLNQYPYSSVNAFNFWGLFGFWQKDGFPPQLTGFLVTLIFSVFVADRLWKTKTSRYLLASVVFVTSFLFFTRMHERHLLPVFAPLAVVAASLDPILWVPYAGFSLTYIANLYFSYWTAYDISKVLSPGLVKGLIILNLALFAFFYIAIFKKAKGKGIFVSTKKYFLRTFRTKVKTKIKLPPKKVKIALLIILAFSFFTRAFWLDNPDKEYFDEVYHAFTARRILHGDPRAWEWWNTPPKGFAYEWTHPPLAKEGMVLGMLIFGENSFGWRIPGALVGVGVVYLIYLITRKLLKDEVVGLLASAVFALDGLPLVMSRIGMNDIYLLFFVLLTIYLFLTNKNFFSALALGLALSSKWSAIWAIPILAVSHFTLKKKLNFSYLWFFTVPLLVYVASYIPMFLTGHDLGTFIGVQKQMWWYHTRLEATHPYTSPWWSWPILLRPIYLYTSDVVNGAVSRIYAMGNPAIFWFGSVSVLFAAISAYIERNRRLGLVIFSYFIFFAPWAVSPRIMFLYHYLPSIPFLAIATGFALKRAPRIIVPFFVVTLGIFIYFYPHWTGISVPATFDEFYYWFSSWR